MLHVAVALACQGCQGRQGEKRLDSATAPILARDSFQLDSPVPESLPDDLNDAGVARKVVATMPPIPLAMVRQEIKLQGALWREAIDSVRAEHTGIILIELPDSNLASRCQMHVRELLLRLLAEVGDCVGPIAWVDTASVLGARAAGESAVVLAARVMRRMPDSAVVEGELSARFVSGRGWRQQVLATWDGLEWVVKPAGIRLSW